MGCRRQRAMLLPFLTSINLIAPKRVQAHRIFRADRQVPLIRQNRNALPSNSSVMCV